MHIASHQCYIQTIPEEEDDPKMKWVPHNKVGTHPFEEPNPEDADTRVWVERDPPLQVCCDYEATVDARECKLPSCLAQRATKRTRTNPSVTDCTEPNPIRGRDLLVPVG